MQFYMILNIFQPNNYENPVYEFIDGTVYDYLNPGVTKVADIYLSSTDIFRVDDPYMIQG